MCSENRDAVQKLASAGIGFYASVATLAGAETVARVRGRRSPTLMIRSA